jgi:hypothetical protein
MSIEPSSAPPAPGFCPRTLGALLLGSLLLGCLPLGCLLLACGAAPPAASPSPPAPVAGDAPQQMAVYPGTPEYRAFLEEIHGDIVRTRAEIEPILEDGDIAQLTIEGAQLAVERIDQERARRVAMILERDYPKDEVGPRWFRRSNGPGRIFVIMGQGTLLLNIDDTGLSLEPGSLVEE